MNKYYKFLLTFLKLKGLYDEIDVKKTITIYMRKKDELIDITEWSNEW